jgi:hypothetical protein
MGLDISDYQDEIVQLCHVYGVSCLELFGSAARRDFDLVDSDLDFLVDFADVHALGAFDRYFGLKEELERLFQRSVDLIEVKAIKNPYFQQAIDKDRVIVYGT